MENLLPSSSVFWYLGTVHSSRSKESVHEGSGLWGLFLFLAPRPGNSGSLFFPVFGCEHG